MKRIKFNIYFKIIIIVILTLALLTFLVPRLLNYPPFSSDFDFQVHVEIIPHSMQHLLIGVIGVILYFISISNIFRNIFKYIKTADKSKLSFDFIKTVRKDCLFALRNIFVTNIVLVVLVLLVLTIIMKPNSSLFLQFFLIYFSFFTFISSMSTTLIKKDLDTVITSTYKVNKQYNDFKKAYKFSNVLIFNIVPFFLVVVITIALLGFTNATSSFGEGNYYYYKIYLENTDLKGLSFNEVLAKLDRIPLKNESDYYFIIRGDKQYFSKSEGQVSEFFIKYADAYLEETDGRVYEYYGIAEEAYVEELSLPNGDNVFIGFKYSTSDAIDSFYLDMSLTFPFFYLVILWIWARNISKSIVDVKNGLISISKNEVVDTDAILPATSIDEIGELAIAFNDIQQLTKKHMQVMQDEHEKLTERERLASLGQLIGGIAHNLKTPIMSISGASEGLSDLVKEYDASIEDSEVTVQDHHDIAKDMNEWIERIKTHASYMSEIITAVKGQAVTLSKESDTSFDLEELVKRVDILMKHEIKHALINFNVSINTDANTVLHGNIASLVQVMNNIISNSIQAYKGEPNKDIDLIVSRKKDDIIISIKDYGPGIPKDVQNKLFKEMITTKGKNGTGLGLFMSYSNIRAHFNGNITFESNKDGTTFNIILPLQKI